ncbi:hypothetical protein [Arthrobacter sp. Soil764]|uniref:hypothetical protein n=1 Tax=Arthrobacter sp. Soil764 TaxID=1736403 RepID=UPI0009EA02AA|nr:hypothetical protein [Arthrobacter sp. Soil764]
MTRYDRRIVGSCRELASGDGIEAFYQGTLMHRGPVTNTNPDYGLFWILDTLTGSACLIDMFELDIVRIPPPAVGSGPFLRSHRSGNVEPATSYWREVSTPG